MDMTGSQTIPAPRETVWQALNDPETLKQAIPGCEEITKESDTEMSAKVTAKVGPVKAKFNGKVTLSDLNPPESYTISGEGKGGAAGFAKGGATVRLEEQDDGQTLMSYEVKANVGGKLAQLGSRLIDGTAKRMADEFFTNLATILRDRGEAVDANKAMAAERGETSAGAGEAAAATAATQTPSPAAPETRTSQPAGHQAGTARVDDEAEDAERHGEPGDRGGEREKDENLTPEERARADAAEATMAQASVTPSNPEQANIEPPSTAPGGLPQGLHPVAWIVALVILVAIVVFLVT